MILVMFWCKHRPLHKTFIFINYNVVIKFVLKNKKTKIRALTK